MLTRTQELVTIYVMTIQAYTAVSVDLPMAIAPPMTPYTEVERPKSRGPIASGSLSEQLVYLTVRNREVQQENKMLS